MIWPMIPIRVDGPAVEPVSLPAMRAHLRLDDGAEDALVAAMIPAARLALEGWTRRVIAASRWRLVLPADCAGSLALPLGPVTGLAGAERIAPDGSAVALDPGLVGLDIAEDPARLRVEAALVDGHRIAVELLAGDPPDAVPADLVQAIRMLVAHWFEDRGDGPPEPGLPGEALALAAPFRRLRL